MKRGMIRDKVLKDCADQVCGGGHAHLLPEPDSGESTYQSLRTLKSLSISALLS